VLLSIGYSACHWCHVMAHESFEDPAVAEVMNALFVNIKVDREERPDVDFIYMSALHALGEQGGWPLTMFLTPDREPFWGGTYFPKTARYGRPGFVDLLRRISAVYRDEPDSIGRNVTALKSRLVAQPPVASSQPTAEELIQIASRAAALFDPVQGGIKGAPKFPNAPILSMLWRAGARAPALREPVLVTLRQMARGGIHDHLGGGFARYSVDERWLVPHFEKMLYDNAQLLELYALAAQATGESIYAEAAVGIVSWLNREMIVDDGFASSLDADSEGEEGRYYVWRPEELEAVLARDEAALFAFAYDISEEGNFEGRSIPNRLRDRSVSESDSARLKDIVSRLLVARQARTPPMRDDKVLADWNGLMIAALARAGAILGQESWIALARRGYRFVRESLTREGLLAHSWRGHVGIWPAFALDHAAMALAALALAETEPGRYLDDARRDLDRLGARYADPASGVLSMNADDGDALIVRPAPTHDDAVPNANGVYLEALIRYAAMAQDDSARTRADALLSALGDPMRTQAMAHASLWSALDLRLNGAQVIVAGADADGLLQAARVVPYPNRILVQLETAERLPDSHPARAMIETSLSGARAFVCVGERCSLPLADPAEIATRIAGMR